MGQRKVMHGLVSRIAVGVFGLLTVAMVLLALFDDHGAFALHQQRDKLNELQSDISAAEQKNEELREEIKRLQEDRDEIERRAREHLKRVKPGEIMLQLPSPAKAIERTPEKSPEQNESGPIHD